VSLSVTACARLLRNAEACRRPRCWATTAGPAAAAPFANEAAATTSALLSSQPTRPSDAATLHASSTTFTIEYISSTHAAQSLPHAATAAGSTVWPFAKSSNDPPTGTRFATAPGRREDGEIARGRDRWQRAAVSATLAKKARVATEHFERGINTPEVLALSGTQISTHVTFADLT